MKRSLCSTVAGSLILAAVSSTVSAAELPAADSKVNREKAIRLELKKLRDTWTIVGMEANGKELPKAQRPKEVVMKGSEFRGFIPGMTFTIDPTKKPKHLDLTVKRDGKKIVTKAIYKLEKDSLVICIPLVQAGKGNDNKRPKDFTTKGRRVLLLKANRKK